MRNSPEAIRDAPLIEAAVQAMIEALTKTGAVENGTVCCAAIGTLMGCIAASLPDTENALAGMNALARGIIDGSLLEP
jgi:hypothetical protein